MKISKFPPGQETLNQAHTSGSEQVQRRLSHISYFHDKQECEVMHRGGGAAFLPGIEKIENMNIVPLQSPSLDSLTKRLGSNSPECEPTIIKPFSRQSSLLFTRGTP